ncbi:DsbA family protein [Nocardioides sp. cx-173]|uniref:DsbA family oxidoreductase n=1 Tax=Nocardioides sp. cx-173 TaxID=2898796 RepID=UPI001E48F318|nr:DsbA family protein [Nocardioides sp. cx-173]MCD4524986.1 DsbA family protein [Nocardioides sp. cx-173]UGB40306.1 DsbA family protein [Nocardioides sp. cx-173]
MAGPNVRPGQIVVFTDVMCGWATIALHFLYRARERAGLEDRVSVDHRLFLLEDVNEMALNTRTIEGEKPVVGQLAEELEFKPWQRDPSEYPVTSALANEAVHAAKEQSARAAEQLDMALRLGFWRDSRCLSMRHEILDIAAGCPDVDPDVLAVALDDGRARGQLMLTYFEHRDAVQGSPHFFLADGYDVHNPGVQMHQAGEAGRGFLVLDSHDPSVYDDLVRRAAATAP